MTRSSKPWLIPSTEIKPGHSAILGGNKLAFYSIHYIALLLISISLISCVIVIFRILKHFKAQNGRRTKLDFSLRFPLYLAVTDLLWGISHFTDHTYLIVSETYPKDMATSVLLSINLWFFLGYQQLMHASLAAYTYLRVVHLKTLDLGRGEWRLHLSCFTFLGLTVILFYAIGAFGCSGYWFLEDRNSTGGFFLSITTMAVCTLNAICTTLGYHLIERKVSEQKRNLRNSALANVSNKGYHSTATQCLTTFVRNAACIYCPFAVLAWAVAIQSFFGVIEPITAFLVVLVANSSGWANACGYFQNEKIKAERSKQFKPPMPLEIGLISSNTDVTPLS